MEMDNGINEEGAVSAIIVAAGRGRRAGLGYNKVLSCIGGMTVLERTIRAFAGSGLVDEIIVVINRDDEEQVTEILGKLPWDIKLSYGGSERQESVYSGLRNLSESSGIVLIHDAARPFVDADIIGRCIEGARIYGAACTGIPVRDTIKYIDSEGYVVQTPERSLLWCAQTPQAFRKDIILKAHEHALECGIKGTDDATLAERLGIRVKMVEGSSRNIKITSREDLLLVEALLENSLRGIGGIE